MGTLTKLYGALNLNPMMHSFKTLRSIIYIYIYTLKFDRLKPETRNCRPKLYMIMFNR